VKADLFDEIRDVVRQHLETEQLLGVRETALPSVPPPAGTDAPAVADASSAAGGPDGGGAPHVQPIGESELAERAAALKTLDEEQVRGCVKCQLCKTRTKTVFGQGHPAARIVFVGEAPGHEEDRQGLAFVGRAGQLLTKMIEAMGLSRDEVFICNVLKCRPPDNRTPAADEVAACSPYLFEQLRLIQPEVVVALGAPAAQTLLGTKAGIGRLRGRFHDFSLSGIMGVDDVIPLMPTYHPAYLLRSPGEKRKAWEDLMLVMARLGLPIPDRYR
jgi:uracil-DNA glycosylase family 4